MAAARRSPSPRASIAHIDRTPLGGICVAIRRHIVPRPCRYEALCATARERHAPRGAYGGSGTTVSPGGMRTGGDVGVAVGGGSVETVPYIAYDWLASFVQPLIPAGKGP